MAIDFVIQASNPRAEPVFEAEDGSLSDAIQTVFPLRTERMLLVWKGIYVPIGYKYDFSMMVDDVLDLATAMLAAPAGVRQIHWPSNTFAAVWEVRWDAGAVTVAGRWNRVVGGTEALLAATGTVAAPLGDFLAEWKKPLELVAGALHEAGYRQEQLSRLALLNDVVKRLPKRGQLYTE